MINYFNFRKFEDKYLVTNDLGHYAFLEEGQLKDLAADRVDPESEIGQRLERDGFTFRSSEAAFTETKSYLVRDCKNYTLTATSLHIFVVTTACNLRCRYCQANGGPQCLPAFMDEETARRAVDVALESPSNHLSFEFQGGEPLLNFPIVKLIVEYAEERRGDKHVQFSLVSNLTLATDEMISFLAEHDVGISTSLDGPAAVHDENRPHADGSGSHDEVLAMVERFRAAGMGVGAIQTTTRANLPFARETVQEYADAGFDSIFVRPLSPLGAAGRSWDEIGYTAEEFTSFYRQVLDAVIELNKGGQQMREGHASLFLAKALHGYPANYMELRSPCGASVGQVAYCPGGDVFTCDEGRMLAEMGDCSFRLGNVHENSYADLMGSSVCRTTCLASVTESIPGCCDCVYQPYCGICPVVNYALDGDLMPKQAGDYRCHVYEGMISTVFKLLYENERETMEILEEWHV